MEKARFQSFIEDRSQAQNIPSSYLKLIIIDILGDKTYEGLDNMLYYEQKAVINYCVNTYAARFAMFGSKKPSGVKPGKEVIKNDTDPANDLDPRTRDYNKGYD